MSSPREREKEKKELKTDTVKSKVTQANINKCFQSKLSLSRLEMAKLSGASSCTRQPQIICVEILKHFCLNWMKNGWNQFICCQSNDGENWKSEFENIKCNVKCLTHNWQCYGYRENVKHINNTIQSKWMPFRLSWYFLTGLLVGIWQHWEKKTICHLFGIKSVSANRNCCDIDHESIYESFAAHFEMS